MDSTNGVPAAQDDQALNPVSTITADEIALYDRQIRLWGVKAQESIQKANVLLIGMKALANEVAKHDIEVCCGLPQAMLCCCLTPYPDTFHRVLV